MEKTKEELIAEAKEYLDAECNVSRYPNLVSELVEVLEKELAERAYEYAEFYPDGRMATGPESWAYYGPLVKKRRRVAGEWEEIPDAES